MLLENTTGCSILCVPDEAAVSVSGLIDRSAYLPAVVPSQSPSDARHGGWGGREGVCSEPFASAQLNAALPAPFFCRQFVGRPVAPLTPCACPRLHHSRAPVCFAVVGGAATRACADRTERCALRTSTAGTTKAVSPTPPRPSRRSKPRTPICRRAHWRWRFRLTSRRCGWTRTRPRYARSPPRGMARAHCPSAPRTAHTAGRLVSRTCLPSTHTLARALIRVFSTASPSFAAASTPAVFPPFLLPSNVHPPPACRARVCDRPLANRARPRQTASRNTACALATGGWTWTSSARAETTTPTRSSPRAPSVRRVWRVRRLWFVVRARLFSVPQHPLPPLALPAPHIARAADNSIARSHPRQPHRPRRSHRNCHLFPSRPRMPHGALAHTLTRAARRTGSDATGLPDTPGEQDFECMQWRGRGQ